MKNKFKLFILTPLIITIAMSGYVYLIGESSTHATVKQLVSFSALATQRWAQISQATGISIRNTDKGSLQPLIPAQFGVLDLVIYGEEIVEPNYKKAFEDFGIGKLSDYVTFNNDTDGSLQYFISGAQVQKISNLEGDAYAAVFFHNVTIQIALGADRIVDGKDGADSGVVRFKVTEDGTYIVGIFTPYQVPAKPQ